MSTHLGAAGLLIGFLAVAWVLALAGALLYDAIGLSQDEYERRAARKLLRKWDK